MDMQVLVSTMKQLDYKLIEKMNIQSDAIIINQCGERSKESLYLSNRKIKWINSDDIGLSKSRNMAINHANSQICLLADDDLIYLDNYKEIVTEQFNLYPEADIITFQVEGIEKKYKDYYKYPKRLNYLTTMKVSSVEIAFKLNSIREGKLKFNELFGAGAKYFAGEENIFLFDCLKQGLIVRYVPIKIARLHLGNSSWFRGFDKEYFIAKGAIFTAMSSKYSTFLIMQFAIRKHKIFKSETSFKLAVKYMLIGRKKYLNKRVLKGD